MEPDDNALTVHGKQHACGFQRIETAICVHYSMAAVQLSFGVLHEVQTNQHVDGVSLPSLTLRKTSINSFWTGGGTKYLMSTFDALDSS